MVIAIRGRVPFGTAVPADPEDLSATTSERRAGCLGLLRAYTRMANVLQRRIDVTVNAALDQGASYGDVAAACGISRQAARQRWLRVRARQEMRSLEPTVGAPDVRTQAAPFLSSAAEGASATSSPSGRRSLGGRAGRPVRVYELAKELGVESAVIMIRLQAMGEFVRSAASTVEAPLARRVREQFSQQDAADRNPS